MSLSSEKPVATVDGRHVPDELLDELLWVLWDLTHKRPLAPWITGHCYPAEWNSRLDADERPERTYETVEKFASIPPRELDRVYGLPRNDDGELPDAVAPSILLPPEGAGSDRTARLMYVDLDDVRDPETDEVSPEVAEIIERVDSYTEISRSGTGVHILVYAEIPDGIGWIDGEPLDTEGSIEMYDHGRFLGATWNHVAGTPTEIHERQDVIKELIEEYAADRLGDSSDDADLADSTETAKTSESGLRDLLSRTLPQGSSGRSPYYSVNLARFAYPTAKPKVDERDGERQGAHPDHGKTTAGDESYNYNLDTGDNQWHCFAHNSGGGPLEMAAIMADKLDCSDAGAEALDELSDEAFLRTCLYARDNLTGFTADMDPPYRALVALARIFDLPMANEDRGILGETNYRYVRAIYDEASTEDL